MKLKNNFFYTLRENAKDEDSISGNLLVKAGFIKKTSAGIYMFMPLGLRVMNKIEQIIREEMNNAGALEMLMPSLIASEYYEKSGRMENFGSSVYQLDDRTGKKMVLGPTHEELFAYAAKSMIQSYKHMPFNLYQFQTKFRDEPRARFGLIRVKEFCMKDAYSFDVNEEALEVSYRKMDVAYRNIFDRLELDYRVVKADTGVMGGLLSEEFQAITAIGEDTIVYSDECDYSSNIEIAKGFDNNIVSTASEKGIYELIYTPDAKSIDEVCNFLKQDVSHFIKTLIYRIDQQFVAVCLKGDREVSEVKLQKLFQANEVALADPEDVIRITGAKVGFAGPIGLSIPIIVDKQILAMEDFIIGANKDNHHYQHVYLNDFKHDFIADIHLVCEGDLCPCGKGKLKLTKGIEVGNIFKLGTKYSQALGLTFLNAENKNEEVWMGSYGIGLGRCLAAVIEQKADEKGIVWPKEIAPFKVALILISDKDELQKDVADKLYNDFTKANIEVIYDDRNERPGVKFNDMELIGIPYRVVVGKKVSEGFVEVKARQNDEALLLRIEEVVDYFK